MTRGRPPWPALICLIVLASGPAPAGLADEPDAASVEFFEKQVRPILVERCIGCHGPEKQKGELRLDSQAAVLEGGTTGPAVEPADAESSLLVEAIRYGDLQMPPKSKLPAAEIEVLTEWVRRGAPWGLEAKEPASKAARGGLDGSTEFARRAEFWSFRPIRDASPPEVAGPLAAWPRNAIDRFLLAALDARGLAPAEEADRRTLIRRLTFDLIGLPPTPEEVEAFVADVAPDAYDRLVDRLLASPRYGERWGRHWLDLVRFAETAGHEFDYDILNAWRYRDYVARALNLDLPYDQFVVEQVAGDLLPSPRRNPADGSNESIQGTGFYWLGEGVHSPLDVREEGVRRVDNQIDVLSKTFLGLTVSCARCHDHKFDPISARDYYALAGFLRSTRHQQAFLDSDVRIAPIVADLGARKLALADLLGEAASRLDSPRKGDLEALLSRPAPAPTPDGDFPPADLASWRASGDAFAIAKGPTAFRIDLRDDPKLIEAPDGSLHSGLISDKLQGVARSPTFTIRRPFLRILAAGVGSRINILIDGFEKVRDPIYGGLTRRVDAPGAAWIDFDLRSWIGHRAYVEACDGASAEFTGATTNPVDGHGWLALFGVRDSDDLGRPDEVVAPRSIGVNALLRELEALDSPLASRIASSMAEYRELAARIPAPMLAPAAVDGDGEDESLMLRGSPKTLGEVVPRRLLAVLGAAAPEASTTGSGRLDLARAMVDPATNPLLPRVLVNRIWKQHFGEGLVRSTDDFGVMGQAPSHPELLDWLASEFSRRGWSIKAMHRLILGSAAYRMSSRATPEADQADPTNALLHRMNVRRLEGEAVRDALLLVAGRLDGRIGGPSVPPHLSPFMEGRGRPAASGPIDGEGRRSLYLQVRRNFLTPLFQVFDAPVPSTTIGRRHASNVPAQALALLNDPLVLELADAWAGRLLAEGGADEPDASRIDRLYRLAFGRTATAEEVERCSAYLEARRASEPSSPRAVWGDLGHALFNVKEFVYVD